MRLIFIIILFFAIGVLNGQIKVEDSESVKEIRRLNREKDKYERDNASLENDKKSLQRLVSNLEEELYSLERARKRRNLETKARLEKNEAEKQKLKAELSDVKNRNNYLESKIREVRESIDSLDKEIKGYKSRISKLEETIDRLVERLENKNEIIDAQSGVIVGLEQKLNGFKKVQPSFKVNNSECKTVTKSYKESGEEIMIGVKKYNMINFDIEYYHNFSVGRVSEIRGYIIVYDRYKNYITHTKDIQTLSSRGFYKHYQVFQTKKSCVILRDFIDKNDLTSFTYAFVPEDEYLYNMITTWRYDDLCDEGVFLFIYRNNRNMAGCRTATLVRP